MWTSVDSVYLDCSCVPSCGTRARYVPCQRDMAYATMANSDTRLCQLTSPHCACVLLFEACYALGDITSTNTKFMLVCGCVVELRPCQERPNGTGDAQVPTPAADNVVLSSGPSSNTMLPANVAPNMVTSDAPTFPDRQVLAQSVATNGIISSQSPPLPPRRIPVYAGDYLRALEFIKKKYTKENPKLWDSTPNFAAERKDHTACFRKLVEMTEQLRTHLRENEGQSSKEGLAQARGYHQRIGAHKSVSHQTGGSKQYHDLDDIQLSAMDQDPVRFRNLVLEIAVELRGRRQSIAASSHPIHEEASATTPTVSRRTSKQP